MLRSRLQSYIIFVFLIVCQQGCSFMHPADFKSKAGEYSKDKQYDQAIKAYWDHIRQRNAVKDKPEWENPYIYLLDIGDLYLEMGDPDSAVETYLLAEEKNVKGGYVNDRLRNVATWYENNEQLQKAIEHLQKYRDRDELLFDLMLNRLARRLVAEEESTYQPAMPEENRF